MRRILLKAIRLFKTLSRLALRVPLEYFAVLALAVSVMLGLLALWEPSLTLKFRRSVHPLKIFPFLCRLKWLAMFTDRMYHMCQTKSIALMITFIQGVSSVLFTPISVILAGLNPQLIRSLLVLVGLPFAIMLASCKVPSRLLQKTPGTGALLTWLTTAAILGVVFAKSPRFLTWVVADVSLSLYLALLAAVLTISAVQERLSQTRARKNQSTHVVCSERLRRTTIYLWAAVLAVWIIRYADRKRNAYDMLVQVDRMMGRGMGTGAAEGKAVIHMMKQQAYESLKQVDRMVGREPGRDTI